ncbi:hypothetical protein BCR36DRAFT_225185, partial [Piromyces finnis]
ALEYYEDILQYLRRLTGLQYLLVTEHVGQAQRHYHVFVQYSNCKRLSIRKLKGAHVEKCFGSAQQNIAYCKAEDEKHQADGVTALVIEEEGEPVTKGGDFTVGRLKDLDSPDEIPAILYNTYKHIKMDHTVVRARDFRKNVKVYWIQGPSGIGKTNKAIDIA